jgi:hypothetical protein
MGVYDEDLAPYLEGFTVEGMLAVADIVDAAMQEALGATYLCEKDTAYADERSHMMTMPVEYADVMLRAHNIGRRAMGLTLDVPDIDIAERCVQLAHQRGL